MKMHMSYVSVWDDKYICRQRWNTRRCLSFPSISQKEVHIAVTVLSSTTDLFSSFTVARDSFICVSHLVLCSIINLFHTRLGKESYLMFYLAVSWGFPSDLGFLCSARHWCVSLALSVCQSVSFSVCVFSLRVFSARDCFLSCCCSLWCGSEGDLREKMLFVDSRLWYLLPVFESQKSQTDLIDISHSFCKANKTSSLITYNICQLIDYKTHAIYHSKHDSYAHRCCIYSIEKPVKTVRLWKINCEIIICWFAETVLIIINVENCSAA